MTAKKPMLAGKYDGEKISFPVYAQPKIDGVRVMAVDGVATTRTLKKLPNQFVQEIFALYRKELDGLDGEMVVKPADQSWNTYRGTMSGLMSEDGEPDFTYYVFDIWNVNVPYDQRYRSLGDRINQFMERAATIGPGLSIGRVKLLETYRIDSDDRLTAYEQKCLGEGHEGIIIRHPDKLYKHGRASSNSGELLKLKRFLDAEAEIIGFEEQMHNDNEATTNALGRTERSSKKDGMVPAGVLGALIVRDIKNKKEFKIGTGFDAEMRKEYFKHQHRYAGKIVKYKYVEIGNYDLPRFPVFVGFRDTLDI